MPRKTNAQQQQEAEELEWEGSVLSTKEKAMVDKVLKNVDAPY